MINYTVTRSKRKTAAIHIHKNGSVEVRCPKSFPARDIEQFVRSNQPAIERRIEQALSAKQLKEDFAPSYGDKLLFLGKEYPLEKSNSPSLGFDGNRFYIPEGLSGESARQGIIKIYKMLAVKILKAKADTYAGLMGFTPASVKVNSAKTRWGSCSGKNSINFSWRLIMASEPCVDYVVVHELAHISQHNHSAAFWAIVEQYVPDYKAQNRHLKELQKKFAAENWD